MSNSPDLEENKIQTPSILEESKDEEGIKKFQDQPIRKEEIKPPTGPTYTRGSIRSISTRRPRTQRSSVSKSPGLRQSTLQSQHSSNRAESPTPYISLNKESVMQIMDTQGNGDSVIQGCNSIIPKYNEIESRLPQSN